MICVACFGKTPLLDDPPTDPPDFINMALAFISDPSVDKETQALIFNKYNL